MTESILLSPWRLRDLQLRNRVVLSPMLTYQARGGAITPWHLVHLGQFASGGVGLVFMESTKVDPLGCTTSSDPGLWSDEFVPALRQLTDFIHQQGAAAGIQLGHSGRKARNSLPWEGRKPLIEVQRVDGKGDWELIAPSALAHGAGAGVPRAMTQADIDAQIDHWIAATRRADAAGFDVLEIHCAHGYLLHQFLSAAANRRSDRYGGSLENRMRFPLDVVRAVRAAWPQGKPLFVRVSAVDESGGSLQETITFAQQLKRAGVDVIDCSAGGMAGPVGEHSVRPAFGYQVPYATAVRARASIATMAVGLIVHAQQAEAVLASGAADLVAIGRELLHNPHWVLDAAVKLGCDRPYASSPPSYAYWLDKRAQIGVDRETSTWGLAPAEALDSKRFFLPEYL
ncbi:NADH:flavin oxidoreductase/NADH oxidase [Diaphorobacter sp. HDW4A]|uniref:NADH:flavin oxidoreductase/NADH oxidase n=1 Tax=Diaphorobacter sp. HDW4A TaxID=2714924 RepID=UPI00140A465E|nr:NADH:flavin oxidoreductase/NADH oxidase [Diaphorobacter sp. HDW4A]QIL80010.1 NADH:flavin oxidoreductase/NADH oxidase [Diaphorobacter sp. HDW4A]